jgi:hypothetical protein
VAGISTEPDALTAASVAIAPGNGSGVGDGDRLAAETFGAGAQAAANIETSSRHNIGTLRWIDFMMFSFYTRFLGRFAVYLPIELR